MTSLTKQQNNCPKHGPHDPGECPQCDELAEARSIVATTYIPPAPVTSKIRSQFTADEALKVSDQYDYLRSPNAPCSGSIYHAMWALADEVRQLRPMAESWQSYEAAQERKASKALTDETSPDVRTTLEDVYRSLCVAWDNRTLPASVLSAKQFTRMREALEIPFPGYAKPGSPVETTPDDTCKRCNGAGEIEVYDQGGPDAHLIGVDCPVCKGSGAQNGRTDGG